MKWKCMVLIFLFWPHSAWAFELYFKDGDKISGALVREDDRSIVIQKLGVGEITVEKGFVDMPKTFPEKYNPPHTKEEGAPAPPPPEIKRNFSLGFTKTNGNTNDTQGQFTADINRKTSQNELTLKYNAYYSANTREMNGRKFYGMGRYAYSFGRDKKWYDFFKLEGDQNRFANVEYRLVPAAGRGYWFSDTEDFKAMTEVAGGYQLTHYRTDEKDKSEAILIPRMFFDKRLFGNLHFSEDFTFFSSLTDFDHYRYRSESNLINRINDHWSLKIQFISEFDSRPATAKKGQTMWITALDYKF